MAMMNKHLLSCTARRRDDRLVDDMKPFGLPWLDSCFQQSLLPNGPWQDKIAKKLCDSLAAKLHKQLDNEQRRQIIYEFLGQQFTQEYFPHSTFSPHILEPPYMTKDERNKLEIEAESWLQHVMNKAATETKCHRPITSQLTGSEPSVEMKEFVQHTSRLFRNGLKLQLYCLQQQLDRAAEVVHWKDKRKQVDSIKLAVVPADKFALAPSRYHSEHTMSRVAPTSSKSFKQQFKLHGNKLVTASDWPVWGHESNCISKSVVAVLRRDPRRLTQVTTRLHGRQLCSTLRLYLWTDVLMQRERNKLNCTNLEGVLRERFAKSVSRGIIELNIKRPTHSPISRLIHNTVVEIYNATAGMQLFVDKDLHITEAAKALNVLYVFDRTYEPYLVYWLFPLQLTFQRGTGESEHSYELAMYLDLLNKGCFPKWPEIFAVAERVMSRLNAADPVFHQHLQTIAYISPSVNAKEFLVDLIRREKTKADTLLATESGRLLTDNTKHHLPLSQEFLADPLLFIRKWVGEGFVGVLNTSAIVYVWDQCFMQQWKALVLEDFCLALLLLLRDKFMMASNYATMRRVFLLEPCKLFTVDIQKSWIHIQSKQSLADIPGMNRLRMREGLGATPFAQSSTVNIFGPFGIKNIAFSLFIPTETLDKELWLNDLTSRIHLSCFIYFGDSLLDAKSSHSFSFQSDTSVDSDSCKKFDIKLIDNSVFSFERIDLSEYDVEQEIGSYPQAVLQLYYVKDTVQTALGWTQLALCQRTASDSAFWQVLEGQKTCTLTPGLYGQEAGTSQVYIGGNCPLQCMVFEVMPHSVTP